MSCRELKPLVVQLRCVQYTTYFAGLIEVDMMHSKR